MSVPLTNEFFGQVSACKFILHIGASSRKGCGTKNLGKNKGFFLHFVSEKSKPHRWIERSEIQLMFARQPTFYKKLDQKLCSIHVVQLHCSWLSCYWACHEVRLYALPRLSTGRKTLGERR